MQTSTGIFTNGVYAMANSLTRLVKKQKPSHLAVAWDITRDTFRKKLYPEYKANRLETAPELKSQFILMQEILAAAGIPQFMDHDVEADDYIGSLARKFEHEIPVFIYTKDQDALQLISNQTRLWLITGRADELRRQYGYESTNIPEKTFEFTPLIVREVYGVLPHQIIDKKALEGDPSDNIPGIHGVGEKASIPLLQEFGSIEAIFEAMEDLSSFKKTCKSLGIRLPLKALQSEGSQESAKLSKILATIKCDCRIDASLDDLKLRVDINKLSEKYRDLEFRSLISELENVPTTQTQLISEQGSLFL